MQSYHGDPVLLAMPDAIISWRSGIACHAGCEKIWIAGSEREVVLLKKELKIVATFKGMHDALKAEELCRASNVGGRLIPTPVDITADCGMSYMMQPLEKEAFLLAVSGVLEVDGLYERYLRG